MRGYFLTDSATTDSFFMFTVGAHRIVLLASMGLFDTSWPGLLVMAYQGHLSFSVVDSDSLCLGLRTTFSWLLVSSHSPSSRLPCSSASTSCSQFRGSASAFSPVDGVSILCLLFRGSTSGGFYSYTPTLPSLKGTRSWTIALVGSRRSATSRDIAPLHAPLRCHHHLHRNGHDGESDLVRQDTPAASRLGQTNTSSSGV